MPPIYVDMDDVLADSTRFFVKLFRREFGRRVPFESVVSFDFRVSLGLSDTDYALFFKRIHQPEVMIEIPPMAGANEVLQRWKAKGYAIHVVTGRPGDAGDVSLAWLEKHCVPCDDFILVDKYGRGGADHPSTVSMETLTGMSFCLAVEDSLKMARHLVEKMAVPVALFDRPWNREAPGSGPFERCETWRDIDSRFETP